MRNSKNAETGERIRTLGQQMGFWQHGFDFPRACLQLFDHVDLPGKRLLEVGCGKGLFCLFAALAGADHVVGLEPLLEGALDSNRCHGDFARMAASLGLKRAEILPLRLQDYSCPKNYFDIVLSVASVNHLDEKQCVNLGRDPHARLVYRQIFERVADMLKPGGTLIIVDCSNRNFFGDRGITNPLVPTIEWHKHREPSYWAELLAESGFANTSIHWLSGRWLRYLRVFSITRKMAYLGTSMFRLEMTRHGNGNPHASSDHRLTA